MYKITKNENKLKVLFLKKKNLQIFFLIGITIISFIARISLRKIESSDMQFFLLDWFKTIKELGIRNALGTEIGDYNISYLLILCILVIIQKIIPLSDILLIKLGSIVFDYVGAIFVALIIYELLKDNKNRKLYALLGYGLTISLPSIIIDSSVWGQCDFIYVSFILISIYFLLKNNILFSFIFLGISFAFKLQFIFILPLYCFLYLKIEDISILHFFILPLVNIIFCMPAVIAGRSFKSCLGIYLHQTQSYEQMTLNFPNFYSVMRITNSEIAVYGVLLTIMFLCIFLFILLYKNYNIRKKEYIDIGIVVVGICTYFLPHMHERYGFAIIVLMIIYVFINKNVIEIISFLILELIYLRLYSSFFNDAVLKNELEIYGIMYLLIICSVIVNLFKKLEKDRE